MKKVENPTGRVLGRSNNNANANAGVAYSNTNNASTNSNTNNGGRLCLFKRSASDRCNAVEVFIVPTANDYGIVNSCERKIQALATA